MNLAESAKAWGTPAFSETFKKEVIENAGELPLQQGLSSSSYALTEGIGVMVISMAGEGAILKVKAGIFFEGVQGGCSCADDPTPVENRPEYCEVLFEINGKSGEAVAFLAQ